MTTRLSPFTIVILTVSLLLSPKPVNAATLSLSPGSGSYAVNQTFDVTISLDTQGADTSGVDAIILFDNTKLNLTDIVSGSIYDQYVGEQINNSSGRATISGLANSTSTLYDGSGTFATLKFRTIENGTANVSFEFTPGNANDSNVAEINVTGDVLTSASGGTYTISTSGSTTTTTTTTTNNTTTNQTSTTSNNSTDSMPVSGSSFPALIIALVGGFFLWLGSFLGKEA